MLSKIGAWREILKLGINARKRAKELRDFYRANSINVLRNEGWFDFMASPRTIENIADHFGYTDLEFLKMYLDAYSQDDILIEENGTFRTNGSINEYPIVAPDLFDSGIIQIAADAALSIPNRLKGIYTTFSDDMNTFNWDDTLQLKMYEQIRRAAFRFANATKRGGRFIDVGCGSGVSTAAIWGYFYKEGAFESDSPIKIYGLEYDPNLQQIAEEEFSFYVSKLFGIEKDVVEALKEHHPVFLQGNAEELPFEDEYFDMVYTSQVLHWCDAEKATKDMMRVLKSGGIFFGTEAFSPMLDSYVELWVRLNEGAYGSIKKKDFIRWVKEAGATKAETVTPAGVFRVSK